MVKLGHNRTQIASWLLGVLFLSSVFINVSPPSVDAATSLYGRAAYQGYFSGWYRRSGYAWGCSNGSGHLICGGISATNINSFVSFYRSHLYSTDTHSQRGAAFTVLAMLGVSGPNSGGFTAGVQTARNRFAEWENTVRAYSAAGKINYNVSFSYTTNTAYTKVRSSPTGTWADDVIWRNDTDSAPSIRFDIGNGRYVAIKRSCANMVGELHVLPPPPAQDFSLNPSIPPITSGIVEPESQITMLPRVVNSGSAQASNIQWRLTSFQVAPNNGIPRLNQPSASYNTPSEACQFYVGSGVSDCGPASFTSGGGASGATNFAVGTRTFAARTALIGDLIAGTKMCYALSVQPRAHNSSQWRHSNPTCVTIGKKPKVQVHGSDLIVGRSFMNQSLPSSSGNVSTSTTIKNISNVLSTFGSWVEYGILATNSIAGTASGSAYASPSGLTGATVCNTSRLSFTSAGSLTCSSSTSKGYYQPSSPIPDVAASFPVTSDTPSLGNNPSVNLSNSDLRGVYTATGDVSIAGGNVENGRWVVIHAPSSTVTINGNITYSNDLMNRIEDIPQVVIIAQNINITGNVTQIDAWLVAKGGSGQGKINTCSSVNAATELSTNVCNQQLVVNGPVMARTLLLWRTAGSGTGNSSGDPAEIFNLRPDAHLWAVARALDSSRAQTVYTLELPPRF